MAITKKPSASSATATIDEAAVIAKISRGGSPAQTDKTSEPGINPVVVRIPSEMFGEINVLVKQRRIRTSRHTWLMEAIEEKLEREKYKLDIKK